MTGGRATRVLAGAAVLAALALAVVALADHSEIAGRYWLWYAGREADATEAILAAARYLGPEDARLRELLRVEPRDLRVTFAQVPPSAGGGVRPRITATLENASSRPIALVDPQIDLGPVLFGAARVGPLLLLAGEGTGPATRILLPGEALAVSVPPSTPMDDRPPALWSQGVAIEPAVVIHNRALFEAEPESVPALPAGPGEPGALIQSGYEVTTLGRARLELPPPATRGPP